MDSRRRRRQNGRASQGGRANQERAGGFRPRRRQERGGRPSVKSEPVAPPPAQQVPIESAAVDEAVIAAALAPQAPEASAFVEVIELEAVRSSRRKRAWRDLRIFGLDANRDAGGRRLGLKSVELWSENAQAMMASLRRSARRRA